DLCQRFTSIDTTSFSVSGEYDTESDERTITVTKGYSKDHRPDLNQVVLELVNSQDGGIPLMMKSFDGNTSDSKIFKDRCQQLLKSLNASDGPHYLVGDSKLYCEDNAKHLSQLKFITRIPRTYKEESKAINAAITANQWVRVDTKSRCYEYTTNHLGIEQRWLVVDSQSARERAKNTLDKQVDKEFQAALKAAMHLRNKPFDCKADAVNA
ncbi:IS1634 family transposase, partial [Facilibium subflavum]|uniref:IS1634 family transposase n=1 Tax=Facilibium subflavum TaxID=2219058 RepID=UPI000E64BA75